MEEPEQDNEKIVITQRFIDALDYLIDSGRVKNVTEFEKMTGFRAQRITGMRAFLKGDVKAKGHYAGTQHLKTLKDLYNVSMDFIFDGTMPIVVDPVEEKEDSVVPEVASEIKFLKQEIKLLRERFDFLNEKIELYKQLLSQRLS